MTFIRPDSSPNNNCTINVILLYWYNTKNKWECDYYEKKIKIPIYNNEIKIALNTLNELRTKKIE